jgi:hypothetical protein
VVWLELVNGSLMAAPLESAPVLACALPSAYGGKTLTGMVLPFESTQ